MTERHLPTVTERHLQMMFYLLAMFLNAVALIYAVVNDQYLYAGAFVFVLAYLLFRLQTRERFAIGGNRPE